jgi:hypothetical protein
MFTLRKGAIVGLGMFAGVGMSAAQACDNDRFPCPVVSEAVTNKACRAPKVAKRHPLPARRVKRRLRSSGLRPAPRMISRQRRRYLPLRLFSRQLRMNHPRKRIKLWWRLPGQLGRLFPPSIVPR